MDQEISGIDVLELENAAKTLWQEDIYAETGMGCSGPVILVAAEDRKGARKFCTKPATCKGLAFRLDRARAGRDGYRWKLLSAYPAVNGGN